MFDYRGKTALVTGASSGMGEIFAVELAKRGMNVILLARSEEKLRTLAADIQERYHVRTEVIVVDLSQENITPNVVNAVQQMELTVDLLVNNAGFLNYGLFEQIKPEEDRAQIMANVLASVNLTHAFIPPMLAKGEGAVIAQSRETWDISNNSLSKQASKELLVQPDSLQEEHKPQLKRRIFLKPWKWWVSGLIVVPVLLIMAIILVYSRTSKSSLQPVSETKVVPKAVAAIGYLEPQGEVIKI